MYINGQWLEEGPTFEVYNPATGVSIGSVIDVSNEQVLDAVAAAEAAFPAWSKTTAYERSAILTRCHTLMMERQRTLAELMTSEQGKPLKAAMNEVKYAADFLLWFAKSAAYFTSFMAAFKGLPCTK